MSADLMSIRRTYSRLTTYRRIGLYISNEALATLDKHRACAVYCRSGKRSAMAASLLSKEGFKVTNLLGGIIAWNEAKKKTVKE